MALCKLGHLLVAVLLAEINWSLASQVYIAYMGRKSSESPDEVLRGNHQMLAALHGGSAEKAQESHVYSYSSGFRGFAAKLTEEEARSLAEMPGVVSVFPNLKRQLHTTYSWEFMGLATDESMQIPGFSAINQENVIIGFIDTGIWPESSSFSDSHMPPVPSRWKGECQTGEEFNSSNCNRKLIGARYYSSGFIAEEENRDTLSASGNAISYRSPRDSSGHGSHTASTAAGRFVSNMNYNGLGAGGARGGAPMARVAVYKTCWDSGCYDADILAAFDDAIKDGVDVLSLSLGPEYPQGDYFNDAISIGSFHAANHGILVVASAGNSGVKGSATNLAPWMLTVAAGATDRDFSSDIILGDGNKFTGESLNIVKMSVPARIISASEARAGYFTPYQASYCLDSSLNRTKARGKVLICRQAGSSSESKVEKSLIVKKAGAVGMILVDEADKDVAIPYGIPAASVGKYAGDRILLYANRTKKPRSVIMPTRTVIGSHHAPRAAAFSSKGPNSLTPDILKPDIAAPGLNILASWSPARKNMNFNILSGTSMACPHVTGIVALIKAANPTWSPSAIKSAIMTTASILNKNGSAITADPDGRVANPFDYGSGFLDPRKALNPGLVYDAKPADYSDFLCSIGYDDKSLRLVTGDGSFCSKKPTAASNLNYPSISVPNLIRGRSYTVTRTVTNVGEPGSVYQAVVSPPAGGINVAVSPKSLAFSSYGQKLSFAVSFTVAAGPSTSSGYVFGSLSWNSKQFQVTSPLIVRVASSHRGNL